jgi:hypothetical protein
MATPSTVEVVHPEIPLAAEPQTRESRLRRFFRRPARPRRTLHRGWRDEATLRAATRLGA